MQTETLIISQKSQMQPSMPKSHSGNMSPPVAPPAAYSKQAVRWFMESLIILAVVVMLVRGFALEGYLIHTGSMAPTLLGYHQHIICPKCNYAFAFGADQDSFTSAESNPRKATEISCPHCGQQQIDISDVPVVQGDQLLVHKYAYDFGHQPDRLEVVLFRNPQKPKEVYVKRVLGLPGELIHLFGGDLFVNGERFRKNLPQQYTTRMLVHDTRHDLQRSRWQPAEPAKSHWQQQPPGWLYQADQTAEKPDWLVYEHRMVQGNIEPIYDTYGYNKPRPDKQRRAIHDLMLALPITVTQPVGQLQIQIRFQRKVYELQIDFKTRVYQLSEVQQQRVLEQNRIPDIWHLQTQHLLEFSLIDQQLLIALDRQPIANPIPLEHGIPELFDVAEKVPWQVRIGAHGGEFHLANIQLYRDIYYTQRVSGLLTQNPMIPETYQISENGYFMLGDNSPISSDSREWTIPEVAGHLILGKPLLVHLPSQPRKLTIGRWSMRIRIPDWSRIRYIN